MAFTCCRVPAFDSLLDDLIDGSSIDALNGLIPSDFDTDFSLVEGGGTASKWG
jgi:hypothetical protein